MQIVHGHPDNAQIIVDYAHTPDALAAALEEDLDGVALNPSFDRNAFRIVLTHFAPPAAEPDDEEGEE